MFNLQNRINGNNEDRRYLETRIAVRDKLLAQEIKDIEAAVRKPKLWKVHIPSTKCLHELDLTITPQEGMYQGGTFKFKITVPPEYNNTPPVVKCLTRIWHPNINEDGSICLSLLRQNSLDAYGWRPTRNLLEVVHGLVALFNDLIDFDDALNIQAAEQWTKNREEFKRRARDYITRYCKKN